MTGNRPLKRPSGLSVSTSGNHLSQPVQRGDMPVVPDFAATEPTELLYRRFRLQDFQNGHLLPSAFRFLPHSGPSFNRSRFSEPEHVLHPDCCDGKVFTGWGVLQAAVANLPSPVPSDDGRSFAFSPQHVPQDTCYAHSQLWCRNTDAPTAEYQEPPRNVREKLRVRLALGLSIRISATL
jgi:hypothetical protein